MRLVRLALLGLSLASLAACRHARREQALRAKLQEIQAVAINRKPRNFMHGMAKDFAGTHGMDRAALQQYDAWQTQKKQHRREHQRIGRGNTR